MTHIGSTESIRLTICASNPSLLFPYHACLDLLHIIIQASGVFSFSTSAVLSSTQSEGESHFGTFAVSICTPSSVDIKANINHVL